MSTIALCVDVYGELSCPTAPPGLEWVLPALGVVVLLLLALCLVVFGTNLRR